MYVDAGPELETRGIKRADPSDLHALDLRDRGIWGRTEPASESQARYAADKPRARRGSRAGGRYARNPSILRDDVLTHRLWGIGFFALLNAVVFLDRLPWSAGR